MAQKKFLDNNGLSYYHTKAGAQYDAKYVAQVSGKGLSTNDYTTAEKEKLAAIAAGADVNVIETVKVNGSALTPDANKAVDVTVPTKTSDLTNDSTYQTQTEVNTAISTAIAGVTQFDYQVVQTLPATGVKGTIYLVSNSGSSTNVYDEYLWISNNWEKIGTTDIDLSGYYTSAQVDSLLAAKADSATTLAGYGITNAYTKQETDTLLDEKLDEADLVAITNAEIDAIVAA